MTSYRTLLVGLLIGMAFGVVFMWEMVGERAVAGMGHDHGSGSATHEPVEVRAGQPIPEVTLGATQDPMGGWNLHIETTNFTFAPQRASGPDLAGEGHAHLYVDGQKYARLYSPWFHLPSLAPGEHELLVTLNANNHAPLHAEGIPIESRVTVTQP